MALLLQSGSTAAMPLVASLPEQPSRRLSFLPMALIFLPLHLSAAALAVLAPRARVARTPIAAAAANSFIFVPFIEPSGERRAFILRARRDRQAEKWPLGLPGASTRPDPGPSRR